MKIKSIKTYQKQISYKETIVVAGRGYSSKDAYDLEVETDSGIANPNYPRPLCKRARTAGP